MPNTKLIDTLFDRPMNRIDVCLSEGIAKEGIIVENVLQKMLNLTQ